MSISCVDHGENCQPVEMKALYRGKFISTKAHFLDHSFFSQLIMQIFSTRYSKLRLRFTRGFTYKGEIFLKENVIFGREKLIKHEFGHLFGLEHTFKPHLMNPAWGLRWFSIPLILVEKVSVDPE